MKYIFFDVECANCLNGEGKICSLGYVKTDEHFHLEKKKDILIDPEAKFLLGNQKTGQGIHLAYPLFRFRQAYTFPKYYSEIKALLSNPEHLVFGFASFQDVSYLYFTCKRYHLQPIEFHYFDVQKLEQIIHSHDNPNGLDKLIDFYHLESFIYHRSDDDAHMTMNVYQAILKELRIDVMTSIQRYPSCYRDANKTASILLQHKHNKQKAAEKRRQKEAYFATLTSYQKDVSHYDPIFWDKKIFFGNEVYDHELEYLKQHTKLLYHKGATIVRSPLEADYIVSLGRNGRVIETNNPKTQYMDFSTFQKFLLSNKK